MKKPEKVLIVGGVAGGASAAARARRLDESCEIVVFDRGPFVSFANCGLPYYVGNVIEDESKLLMASPESFRDRFRIDVRVVAGFVASNMLRGDMPTTSWAAWLDGQHGELSGALLVDVRSHAEFATECVAGAVNIPLEELRARHCELPKGKVILLYCEVGQRAYYATRLLLQLGHEVRNLPGGMQTYRMVRDARPGRPSELRTASSPERQHPPRSV